MSDVISRDRAMSRNCSLVNDKLSRVASIDAAASIVANSSIPEDSVLILTIDVEAKRDVKRQFTHTQQLTVITMKVEFDSVQPLIAVDKDDIS